MIVEVGGEDYKVENTKNLLEATLKAVRNVPNKMGTGVFIGNHKAQNLGAAMV